MSANGFIRDSKCEPLDTSIVEQHTTKMSPPICDGDNYSKVAKVTTTGGISCHSVKTIAAGPLNSLQTQITKLSAVNNKLRGKAKLELKEWKVKAGRAVEGIKQKVKEEVKQMELNERRQASPGHLVSGLVRDEHGNLKEHSRQLVGGWVFTRQQMAYLKDQPYMYNASAGSYLELFCLQR